MELHNEHWIAPLSACVPGKMCWAHSGQPTWVAHIGPISTRRTLCFGSEVGGPGGAHIAVQMGPTWDPYIIPVGVLPLQREGIKNI